MAVQGAKLTVEFYVVEKDGICEIDVTQFIKYLKAMGDSEETIAEKLEVKLQPTIDSMVALGFTEQEATDKVATLLEEAREEAGV